MTDRDTINLQDLPPNISNSKAQGGQCHEGTAARTAHGSGKRNKWREMKAEQEAYNIQMLLDECGGNVSQVASRLNISRNTLYRKINQYNLFTLR
jgi:transcriptional regulator of acetoin/glycerol metabolism